MKDKEADIYLSIASFLHLAIIGTLGTLITELFAEEPRTEVMLLAMLAFTVLFLISIAVFGGLLFNQKSKKKL